MKSFHYSNGPHYRIVSETEIARYLSDPKHGDSARLVLSLEIGHTIEFPSGATYRRMADDTPGMSGIICVKRTRSKPCRYCDQPSSRLCDFPIGTFRGKPKTCDTPMCERCTTKGSAFKVDYCHDHAGGLGLLKS